jgi:hypothetical protein
MKFFLIIVFFLFANSNWCQSSLNQKEKELLNLYQKIKLQESFEDKVNVSHEFNDEFKKALNQKDAFKFPFDSLAKLNGFKSIISSDQKVRVFTWGIKNNYDATFLYFGLVIRKDGSKNYLYELKDNLDPMNIQTNEVLESSKWYGAIYVDIIHKKNGSKNYYTVLGWDGNSSLSNLRILDVFSFSGKNLKLGAPLFKNQKAKLNRVYFEYAETANMNMNYESKYNRIMFDHLIPETPDLKGIYSFYIPDFSYDSYIWRRDAWYLMEDVIGVNEKEAKKLTILTPDGKGRLKKKKVKNKWVSPNDDKNPNDFNHVARTPESEMQVETPEKKTKQKKYKTKKQSDPLKPESIYNKKKKRKRTKFN